MCQTCKAQIKFSFSAYAHREALKAAIVWIKKGGWIICSFVAKCLKSDTVRDSLKKIQSSSYHAFMFLNLSKVMALGLFFSTFG